MTPVSIRLIRPLAADDVPVLQSIDQVAHGEQWSTRVFKDELAQDNRVHLVAELDQNVIGHASALVDGPTCRITNVAVSQDYAGDGHGSALLMALLRSVLAEHRILNVQLEVRPSNRRAQRLYNRFGFVPVGIERNFYDRSDERGSCDALVMMVADVHADTFRGRLDELQELQVARERGAAA